MGIQKPTIVIFDMDGTAVRHINPRLLSTLEFLDNLCYKTSKFFAWVFKRGAKGNMIPEWHDPEWDNPNKKKPRLLVHRAMHKFRRKPVEQIVQPCPGIYDVLELLREHNIPMALVSNGLGKGYGHDILEKFDLNQFFKVTIFREDITKSKPNPEPILLALKQMDVEPQKTDIVWYIGDRHKDVIAALAASEVVQATITPIAVAFNAAVAVMEKNLGSDHIIMSFHDMYDQLRDMFEKNGVSHRVTA
ncbi:MAG: HAD-IA family hydrolase [Alphaproteobacteria bacterium]|nr:HAD-IA family hydrolase [Alphaproteobacteria bacterium]